MVNFKKIKPHPLLKDYIKHYWTLTAKNNFKFFTSRIFPDGCVEVLYNLGSDYIVYPQQARVQNSYIVGTSIVPMQTKMDKNINILSVTFKPGYANFFLDVPAKNYANDCIECDKIFGKESSIINEYMTGPFSLKQKIDFLEKNYFLNKSNDINSRFLKINDWIKMSNGLISVEKLANASGLCLRQFERNFIKHVGMTPKNFLQVTRFQKSLKLIKSKIELVDIAYSLGYSDQSHFNRQFKKYSGTTPSNYKKHQNVVFIQD